MSPRGSEPGRSEETPAEIDVREGQADEEEAQKQAEQVARDTLRTTYTGEREAAQRGAKSIEMTNRVVTRRADAIAQLDRLDGVPAEPRRTTTRNPGPRIQEQRGQAQTYREQEVATQGRTGRFRVRAETIALFCGIVVTVKEVADLLMNILGAADAGNGQPAAPSELTEEQQEQLRAQVERWWSLSDAAVWESVATYCDRWNPSWQAQLLMMDTIIRMSQDPPQEWTFEGDDEVDLVESTSNAYADFSPQAQQHQSSAIYRHIATLTYDGYGNGAVPLPRQVAADVAQLSITDIVTKETAARPNA